MYLYERHNWTSFEWNDDIILPLLSQVRFEQGRLLGRIKDLGFDFEADTELDIITDEIIFSSQIEGISLNKAQVRSSVSRQLGIDIPNAVSSTEQIDNNVEVMLDATKNFEKPLSKERLASWHAALFPRGFSGLHKVLVAEYRKQEMQVVSGPLGKEKIHYTAPAPERVPVLMDELIEWLNENNRTEALIKAGITHLWFVTIHPFDDGNGRIARALTELFLARSDGSARRFYSMAGQILSHREDYYNVLEASQKGDQDITLWLVWFLETLQQALNQSDTTFTQVLDRSAFWKNIEGIPLNERQRKMLSRLKGNFEGKLTSSKWAKICKVSQDTAARDIKDLIVKGILEQESGGGRSTSYIVSQTKR